MTALPDRQFFKIGEAAEIVGVKTHVLRYWETEFPSIKPLKTRGAHRMYRRADVELLRLIHKLLHHEGYTIAGARKRVRELRAELRRGGQNPGSTQAAGASAFGLSSSSARPDPSAPGACPVAEGAPSQPDAARELSASPEDAPMPSALHDAATRRSGAHGRASALLVPGTGEERGVDVRPEAARALGASSEGARELGAAPGELRELGLWKEATRELELRAELIQLRRELCELMRELDRLSAPKRVAAEASATVTAVVPKTVLIAQRRPLR